MPMDHIGAGETQEPATAYWFSLGRLPGHAPLAWLLIRHLVAVLRENGRLVLVLPTRGTELHLTPPEPQIPK